MDFFYRKRPWYAGQFVRKVIPKFTVSDNYILFFTTLLNRLKPNLLSVLVRDVDNTFLNSTIQIPITADGAIDFEFIAEFVAELEAQRVAELETYLQVTGMRDYNLTDAECQVLTRTDIEWKVYQIEKLFDRVSTTKLPYKANDLPKQQIGEYSLPCLTSSFMNQGLNYYVPREGATILKNVISIPSNSDVYRAYYQSNEFTVLSDAYAIQWKDSKARISDNQYLFMVMCINKVTDLPIYSYNVPPKSLVILYFPSEKAPAPPKPLIIEQLLQPIQVLIFSPSIGHFLLSKACPASNTPIFKSEFCFTNSYAAKIPPGPAPTIITSYFIPIRFLLAY